VLAKGGLIIWVKSIGDVAAELAKINFPVGTIYFVTHSAPSGGLQFGNDEKVVPADQIAAKLKGLIPAEYAPEHVDFRGCSVGVSPKAMDSIRLALGANTVIAGTCYAVINRSKLIKLHGKEITKDSDVAAADRNLFATLRQRTLQNFHPAERACILNKSEKDFFVAGGRFVSLYFNQEFKGDFIPGKSICYTDLVPQIVDPNQALAASPHCQLIEVEEPKSIGPQPGGQKREYDDPDFFQGPRDILAPRMGPPQ
jgi:hypothetical protein